MNSIDAPALKIQLQSFSFKKGLPLHTTEHGGGFVFDCRWIDNPGRIERYKTATGADEEVQDFLLKQTEMPLFLSQVHEIVRCVIQKYQQRGFEHLTIDFGCTGGQHRSVFAAIATQQFIDTHFPKVQTKILHREQPQL